MCQDEAAGGMEGDDWEQSKENIQPLRQGRAMSSLHAALAPQCQDDLRRKRREFEELLRTTSGVDLLDVYHRYVVWVEQHFPAGGHGVNLKQLLEQAITQFTTSEDLFNDERYVGIWLRYVSLSAEPLAVLKAMFESGVGVQCAQFFLTWAYQLEAARDSRRASRVLRAGIDRRAEPTSKLEEALRHLEARVSQQVARGVLEQAHQPHNLSGTMGREDVRPALAPLKARGKQGMAPVTRTGPLARPAEQQAGGGLALVRAGQAAGNRGHTKVRVCADENAPPEDIALLSVPAAPLAACTITTASTQGHGKENSRSAGQWVGVKAKQRLAVVPGQPSFEIPEDEGGQPAHCTPVLVPGSGTALSVRREPAPLQEGGRLEGWVVPLMLHEPPDPTRRPMYDKASVYRGATEFQFEELRVAVMHARQRRLAEERLQRERQRADLLELEQLAELERKRAARCERELAMMRREEQQAGPQGGSSQEASQIERLQCEVLRLHKELEEMRALLASTRSGTRDYSRVADQIQNLERTIIAAEQSMVAGHGAGMDADVDDEQLDEETPSGVQPGESGAASPPGSAQSGGSLRTVDVSRVVRGLWNCSLAQSRLEPPSSPQQTPAVGGVDEAQAEAGHGASTAVPTTSGAATAMPFEVFCEPTQTGGLACSAGLPMDALPDDGNDENRPPTNYGPPELPLRTKPLQGRTPFAVLEPEQGPVDDDDDAADKDNVLQGIEPLADDENFTYAASKSFTRKVTSTPFASEKTLPEVGEHFTLGGLTALVQGITLEGQDSHLMMPPPATTASAPSPPKQLPPPSAQQVVQQQCQPGGEPQAPASMDAAVVPLARRRFSTAADLSTILECSKEGKSGSSSSGGSSSCSSSSHHTVGVAALSTTSRPLTGGNSCLPAVREEEQDDNSPVFVPATGAPPVQHENGTEGAVCDLACPDPFSQELRSSILSSWQPCESDRQLLFEFAKSRPVLKADAVISLGGQDVKVLHHLAAGAYARVYVAEVLNTEETYVDNDDSFQAPIHDKVVLKVNADCSNSWWETYICCELRRRLAEAYSGAPIKCAVDLRMGCFFPKSAILVFPYCAYGTLLDVVGRYQKQGKRGMPECLVLYFTLELFISVELVHSCGIIHADVKPDNVLVVDFPSEADFLERFTEHNTSCVQLIDFGRSIDMWQVPPGTAFTKVVETDGFACTEMRDSRPWTYQTDWFGVLGCLHVLLFGEYMELERLPNGIWSIRNKFKRYWQQDLWNRIFATLLNIPSCTEQPDVTPFAIEIQALLRDNSRAHNVVLEALRAKNF